MGGYATGLLEIPDQIVIGPGIGGPKNPDIFILSETYAWSLMCIIKAGN